MTPFPSDSLLPEPPVAATLNISRRPQRSLCALLLHRWWMPVLFSALFGLGGLCYVRTHPLMASSNATLEIELVDWTLWNPHTTPDTSRDARTYAAQDNILTSPAVLEDAIARGQLRQLAVLRSVKDPVAFFQERVNAQMGKMERLLTISFDAPDPHEANRVLQSIIDAYARQVATRRLPAVADFRASFEKETHSPQRGGDEAALGQLSSELAFARAAENISPVAVRVLEPPHVVESSSLRAGRTILIALAAGLLLGMGTALVSDWLDDRMLSSEELREATGGRLLAAIPRIRGDASEVAKISQQPASEAADAYRNLAISLGAGAPSGCRTLLVVAAEGRGGASTVASNLAITQARAGNRVLLIDANLRSPSLASFFRLTGREGLGDSLLHKKEPLLQNSGIESLEILCAGVERPQDLLAVRPQIKSLLAALAPRYDWIILDSAPVLSASDARIFAGLCDGVLLALRVDATAWSSVSLAFSSLSAAGAKTVDAIATAVPRSRMYADLLL